MGVVQGNPQEVSLAAAPGGLVPAIRWTEQWSWPQGNGNSGAQGSYSSYGVVVGSAPWGPLDNPGNVAEIWSWQQQEGSTAWRSVDYGLGVRGKALTAAPTLDAVGLARELGWEVEMGPEAAVGVHLQADFSAGLDQSLFNGLGSQLRSMQREKRLENGEELAPVAGTPDQDYLSLPNGGRCYVYAQSEAYRNGVRVGQAVSIMMMFATGPVGTGLNLGLEALRLTASALKMRRAWKNGDYAEVALQGAGMGLTAVRYSPLCKVKGAVGNATRALVTAGQIGFGLYGAYQGVQQALVQFEKGQYLDGALSLLQATADVYAGTRSCFTGEMLILCAGGKKRADAIALGDLVWTRDEDDPEGPLVLKRVVGRFVTTAPIWHVTLADGQVLRTTMEHPFWVGDRREWVAARELVAGDLVRTEGGRVVAVERVAETDAWETVYNWTVEDYHTYFVSATEDGASIWAHNACRVLRERQGRQQQTVLEIDNPFPSNSPEYRQLRRFVGRWNAEIANAGGELTRRTPTAAEKAAAHNWARRMRRKYPDRLAGREVGHVPDVAAGGRPVPSNDRFFALFPSVNKLLSSIFPQIPNRTTYNGVRVVR